jgi:hypothetical protein
MSSNQKVFYFQDCLYIEGIMEYDMDNSTWCFSQQKWYGDELWGTSLPHLARDFQLYIDDAALIPGWHNKTNFLQSSRRHLAKHIMSLPRVCFLLVIQVLQSRLLFF